MSETLGSLVDKLTIKMLREYHIAELARKKKNTIKSRHVHQKATLLKEQKVRLMAEIDSFVRSAIHGLTPMVDEKLKLYNKPEDMNRIIHSKRIGRMIAELAHKNIELWHLEDEARREDVHLSYIGTIKRKIDKANQQRNDLIDAVDCLFARTVRKHNKKNA